MRNVPHVYVHLSVMSFVVWVVVLGVECVGLALSECYRFLSLPHVSLSFSLLEFSLQVPVACVWFKGQVGAVWEVRGAWS